MEVSDLLLLDEDTIRNNYNVFSEQGIDGLLSYNYVKPMSYLSTDELKKLEAHLTEKMYLYSKNIKQYIELKYGVIYTLEGTRALLERLNFVYKKQNICQAKAT